MSLRPPTTELLDDFNAGDALSIEVTLTSPVDPYPVLDLTDSVVKFGMRRLPIAAQSSPDQLTVTLTLTDPENGKALLFIYGHETAALTPGEYVYGFVLTDPLGNPTTIIEARLTLRPEVTEAT